jgi:hypothetical protein
VPTDDGDILEDAPSEGKERDQVQVDAEAIAEKRERRSEKGIGVEAGQEDTRVEVALELGTAGPQERIQGGQDAYGGVASPFDRKVEAKREPEEHPSDKAEEREEH